MSGHTHHSSIHHREGEHMRDKLQNTKKRNSRA